MHNKLTKNILQAFLLLFFSFIITENVSGQTTTIRGAITDFKTGEPIPFVNVFFEETSIGKTTDFNGQYFIETNEPVSRLRFSLLGYKTELRDIRYGESQILSLKMTPEVKQLKELNVKGEKQRYRNKSNPAVELIRLVIPIFQRSIIFHVFAFICTTSLLSSIFTKSLPASSDTAVSGLPPTEMLSINLFSTGSMMLRL